MSRPVLGFGSSHGQSCRNDASVAAVDRQEVQIGRHHTRSNLICLIVSSVYLHWRGCQSGHWIQPLARRD